MTVIDTPNAAAEPPVVAPAPKPPVRYPVLRLALVAAAVALLGFGAGVGWLAIVGALIVMIFLHELGHYMTARWAGMKVTEFFIGFGPRIWSFRRGEVEYGLKAIPAGAYVKIIGMNNLDPVAPEDEPRAYRQKSYPRRISVAVAGSAMHFMLAIGLFFLILVAYGVPGNRVFDRTEPDPTTWVVGAVTDGKAAEKAGIREGDRILSIGGGEISVFEDVGDRVRPNPGATLPVVLERAGKQLTVDVTLGEAEDCQSGGTRGFLGVGRGYPSQRLSPIKAAPAAVADFGTLSAETVKGMGKIFSPSGVSRYVSLLTSPAERTDAGGATSEPVCPPPAGTEDPNEGRLISIFGAARIGAQAFENGFIDFLFLLAMLNVFIGIFNLVPLLPLDGGHVVLATYERIREIGRGGQRYFADVGKALPLVYLVVSLMIFIGLSSLYLDIANPIPSP